MASYTVNQQAVARARQLIDARQYVLQSSCGDVPPGADHGRIPADSVRGHYSDARQVLSELEALGIDYGDVTRAWRATARPPSTPAGGELGDQIAARLRRPLGRFGGGEWGITRRT